jgi:hypothetical protein
MLFRPCPRDLSLEGSNVIAALLREQRMRWAALVRARPPAMSNNSSARWRTHGTGAVRVNWCNVSWSGDTLMMRIPPEPPYLPPAQGLFSIGIPV